MAGRKPIVSARQLKARVQIIMRATDKDVSLNSEKNRLISMTESMREAGVLQEFLLDCLRSKLRQDEGQSAAVYRMLDSGQTAVTERPTESQINCQQQSAPVAQSPSYAKASEQVAVDHNVESLPLSHGQDPHLAPAPAEVPSAELKAGNRRAFESSSAIIESVVREIESTATGNEAGVTTPPPTVRRKPLGSLLEAMG